MITIKDIIYMICDEIYCNKIIKCSQCHKEKFCLVNSKIIALNYLWNGEYYG